MPSRSTVMKGRMNMAYFSDQRLKRPPAGLLSFSSRTLRILVLHLSWSLLTRSKAAPMMVMMILATRAKTPSQIFSAESNVFLPAV